MARKSIELNEKQERMYNVLSQQISKVARHNRQGSYGTKKGYAEKVNKFCRFLSKEFAVQKFANISNKHLAGYVKHEQGRGISNKTLKTELSAIRFFHDKVDRPRHVLETENKLLGAERLKSSGENKAWNQQEIDRFHEVCPKFGNERMASVAKLARNEGLRIHETLRIDRNVAEKALKTGEIKIKGKGGKVRCVPISRESADMLKEVMKNVERGDKLFVREGEKTHLVIKQCQNFINRHRDKFQDENRAERIAAGEKLKENVTFHGLRHAYAQDRYDEAKEQNINDGNARLVVSRLLGHERDEVTRIYTTN
ncbi:tyrosine-type recombinase/integrase [Domibacillus sp. A3M-37]|uniref:tyrosine-type recombinase/integrase n=1 Tax=Domibacillus sp. A3M-37 TaxID=2962037 RepID=UPI0020B6E622|nr:tyrosine-type recombinase/integrase [Domibacillus sp. A3M-37]MCP3763752.1 tyrosine-type recombinase/integrase [Domibacillus sp. A3M-37]